MATRFTSRSKHELTLAIKTYMNSRDSNDKGDINT